MTSREFRTPYTDSFAGRLKEIYDNAWRDFEGFNTSNPFKRSMVYIYFYRCLKKKMPLSSLVWRLPFGLLLDALRVFGLFFLLAASRKFLPKLGKFKSNTSFDPKFYDTRPVKHVIPPNPDCGVDETGDCDGEYLWVDNYLNFYTPILGWIFIGWPSVFLMNDSLLQNAIFYLSPFVLSIIPARTGVLYHRRAQLATFYRGWLLPKITVPYNQVSYSAGLDPDGGASWMIIRARVPLYISPLGYVRFYSVETTNFSKKVGAICAFMDQSNNYAQSIRIKESIFWHKSRNKTLQRYGKPANSGQLTNIYQDPESLYNQADNLVDPYSLRFASIVMPDTREQGLADEAEMQRVDLALAKHAEHEASFRKAAPKIREKLVIALEEQIYEIDKNIDGFGNFSFNEELNQEFFYINSKLLDSVRHVINANYEDSDTQKSLQLLKIRTDLRESINELDQEIVDISYYAETVNNSMIILANAYKTKLLSIQDINDILNHWLKGEFQKRLVLADYNWESYKKIARARILNNDSDTQVNEVSEA